MPLCVCLCVCVCVCVCVCGLVHVIWTQYSSRVALSTFDGPDRTADQPVARLLRESFEEMWKKHGVDGTHNETKITSGCAVC